MATTEVHTSASTSQSSSDDWQTAPLVCMVLICLAGAISNAFLLVAFFKHPELKSPTNILVVNQALADLFSCLTTMIYSIFIYTVSGRRVVSSYKWLCVVNIGCLGIALYSSLLNLLAISVDRIVNIQYPFLYARIVTETLVLRCVAGMWFVLVIIQVVPILGWNNWRPHMPCTGFNVLGKMFFVNIFLMMCFLALIFVAIVNIIICGIVINKRRVLPIGAPDVPQEQKSQYKLTKMMLIVVGVFYVCWLPYTIIALLTITSAKVIFPTGLPLSFKIVTELSKSVTQLNSTLNPLIYARKSNEFRRAFKKTLGMSMKPSIDAVGTSATSRQGS